MLARQHARRERLFGVVGQDRHHRLRNDRTMVQAVGHEVHRSTSDLASRLDRTAMRVQARERRQQ